MKNIYDLVESKHLKAADITSSITVTIDRVEHENVAPPDEKEKKKPVLYFRGKEKGLALNMTNIKTMDKLYGRDYEVWPGRAIKLVTIETEYKGDTVRGIRIREANTQPAPATAPAAAAPTEPPARFDQPAPDAPPRPANDSVGEHDTGRPLEDHNENEAPDEDDVPF